MPTEISLAKLLPAHSFFSHAGKTRMSISFFPAIETTIAVPGVMMHRESRSFTGFSKCVQEPPDQTPLGLQLRPHTPQLSGSVPRSTVPAQLSFSTASVTGGGTRA